MARKAKKIDEELEIVDETDASEDSELEINLDDLSDEELDELEAALDAEAEELEDEESEEDENEEISEDADGTGGVPEGASKTNMMSLMMKKLGNMGTDQIAGFYKSLEKFDPGIPAGTAEKNKASIAMKGLQEAIKEDLGIVFGDNQDLSEEFKVKVQTLLESAIETRVALIEADLQEQYEAALEESFEVLNEEYAEKINDYLEYVADEFFKENQIAIESSLRADLSESFLQGLYELCVEHKVSLPDEELDAAQLLADKVEELEEQLNNAIETNIEITSKIKDYEKDLIIADKITGLTQVQADRFIKLAENVDFDGDADEFSNKLDILVESGFVNKAEKNTNLITEETFAQDDDEAETVINDPQMRAYVAATRRTVKR